MVQPISSARLPFFTRGFRTPPSPIGEIATSRATERALRGLEERITRLRRSLERLAEIGGDTREATTRVTRAAEALAEPVRGLGRELTASQLRSRDQLNALPTSFGPRAPGLGPRSTAQPEIGGAFLAGPDEELSFRVRRGGTIGSDRDLTIRVTGEDGRTLDTLSFRRVPAGTPLDLTNGLTLSFTDGRLRANETFQVRVLGDTPSQVDPTKPFDGQGDRAPGFEPGLQVRAGSFEVNGVRIPVGASDSIQDVLERITRSPADVLATFDPATESLVLTRKTPGGGTITLSGDTSGFLAATKLLDVQAELPEFTTLRSSEEVNAIRTSFEPRAPSFGEPDTPRPTISGVYDGSQGDAQLTVRARSNGLIGSPSTIRVELRDPANRVIDELDFQGLLPGTPLQFSNGLTLALGEGRLSRDDRFTLDVFATRGSAVDPERPFDGLPGADPGFEPGLSVQAGSFEINGVRIDVAADDSLSGVLGKITASAADVTATFDPTAERLELRRNTAGSTLGITLARDTSGFLAATKLLGAPAIPGGQGQDADRPLAEVAALAGITSGRLIVNGEAIAIDVQRDTLRDVAQRISRSPAEATASLDPETQALRVVSNGRGRKLELDDGNSGFFSRLNLPPGLYEAQSAGERSRRFRRVESVRAQLDAVREDIRGLLRELDRSLGEELASDVRDALKSSIAPVFARVGADASAERLRSGLGIDADFGRDGERLLDIDVARFQRASEERFDELEDFLFARGSSSDGRGDGLVASLLGTFEKLQATFGQSTNASSETGRLIDTRV